MQYSKEVLHYFFETLHAGKLDKDNLQVRYGEIATSTEGHLFRLYLRCHQNDIITEAKFQAYGPIVATAACEYVCRWAERKTFDEANHLDSDQIQKALNLSSLQVHVAFLIERLWRKTLCF
ncbi:iron-sulfur cluster assembly scaffold protein [Coxiella endosymbiont of Ornithodoros maritimus]|uniref:iron-sulfur cluster assembly scaffold protein n=1 Tax=Coxiella endosymbiont of Ornithodoros maritimus TaxID=1656172 RepID=UPI0022649BCA|nr:iron-sulfur cluster assembly scaffold protein [Coxiella endosymbiont of Ornithodoros maritimus]